MEIILRAFIFLALLLKISFGSHPSDVCGAAAASQCGSCQQLPVTTDLSTPGSGLSAGTLTQTLSKNSAGCAVITATCVAPATAAITGVTFGLNGPTFGVPTPGSTQTLVFSCDDMGNAIGAIPLPTGGEAQFVATNLECIYQ